MDGNLAFTQAEKNIHNAIQGFKRKIDEANRGIKERREDIADMQAVCEHRITKRMPAVPPESAYDVCEVCGKEL